MAEVWQRFVICTSQNSPPIQEVLKADNKWDPKC